MPIDNSAASDKTYASPSSESSFLAFLPRDPLLGALEDIFCATPRLIDEALLPCEGPEEAVGDGALLAMVAGLEPSSSEESPPAKAKSAASKSAIS